MSPGASGPSAALLDQLLARCRFPAPGTAVECGVSGGADSSALLVLAVAAGLRVTAVHVDHGLRPGSAAEADVVASTAERFGAAFEARRALVEDGPNLEDRARLARRAALAPDALLGHTLDDQAETVLLFLLRGVGPEGLAGISPDRRPLLAVRRSETRALCDALGVGVVEDPTNDDPRFRRNRVRNELMPLLDDIAERDVAPLLARTAALQREVIESVEAAAATIDPTDARAVAALDRATTAAVLRRWWRVVTGLPHAPDVAALDRMRAVATGGATAADVVAGWRIARTAQALRLERIDPAGVPDEGPRAPG